MIDLLLATTNQGKKREIKRILASSSAQIKLSDLTDFKIESDFKEGKNSFLDNAIGKSAHYSKLVPDILVVAEDSGLEVKALDDKPGVMSARFYGPHATDDQNIDKLLADLTKVKDRRARFVCTAVLSFGGAVIETFFGFVTGEITHNRIGSQGFGYDPVFYYKEMKKTFAELSTEEKNLISHRSLAMIKLRDFLLQNPMNQKH